MFWSVNDHPQKAQQHVEETTLYNRLKNKQNNKGKNIEEDKKWVTFTYT
jgi:hypothetical protein